MSAVLYRSRSCYRNADDWDARRTKADGGDLFDKISALAVLLLSYTSMLIPDPLQPPT